MTGFATLKRGSIVQVQRAAKAVNGNSAKMKWIFIRNTHLSCVDQIGSRQVLIIFLITGFVLCGVVEQSASVTLRANSTSSYSDEEFAEYVENTSYITRYCQPPAPNESTVYIVRSIPHIEVRSLICSTVRGIVRPWTLPGLHSDICGYQGTSPESGFPRAPSEREELIFFCGYGKWVCKVSF